MPDEIGALIFLLKRHPQISIDGVFTHLASADVSGMASVSTQQALFFNALSRLREAGITPACIHYANSAGIARHALSGCTHVRPGIMLYGCKPDPAQEFLIDLRPIATLKSYIVKIKRVPAGTPVSYGQTYCTKAETCIATIALGYGCGFPRGSGASRDVLIRGKRYRIAGRVTMDYLMVDAGSKSDLCVGDEVVAMGYQGKLCISPDEVALQSQTIAYEILCNLSDKLPRDYIQKGKVIHRQEGCLF
jgi:alanine racemase